MIWIDAETLRSKATYRGLCDAIAAGHTLKPGASPSGVSGRCMLTQPSPTTGGDTNFLALPSWQVGEALGIKACTVFPENAELNTGVPAVQAVYLLFDGKDGSPSAGIDGTEHTYWKTAAHSGAAALYLARPDAKTLVMLGAGGLGPHVIAAHRAARPSIDRVIIWNRTHAKAQALADTVGGEVWEDRDAAVAEADVVSAATNAKSPLILGPQLKPGCHVDLIGSYTPEMREADDETMRLATVFSDKDQHALDDNGDLFQPLRDGVITIDDIKADLYELASGRHPGRTFDEEITLFKNCGGGHVDLMAARYFFSVAKPD